jgi:hypothetical protein
MSADGCIGIVMCNASALVAPWQGKEPRFGTNPIAMSVPGPDTWLLDMATTTVALGKILNAQNHGRTSIPEGWAMDSEGVATTDTETALAGLLMPLGGYKGSGLAMLAEILCAVLSGGAMSTQLGGIREKGQPMRTSQLFLGIDVARFMPLADFERRRWSSRPKPRVVTTRFWWPVIRSGEPKRAGAAKESRCPRAFGEASRKPRASGASRCRNKQRRSDDGAISEAGCDRW